MVVAGIICEYNPFHLGHFGHIERTRLKLGQDCAIVCVMSGNFVQRGEPAIFNKHTRAHAAVLCGADLVIELPTPYAMSSAERFARGGIYILDSLGVCDVISFGSENGNVEPLFEAAEAIVSDEVNVQIVKWLGKGLPYAAAQQKAADSVLGEVSAVFKTPNNLLGIEYIKAIVHYKSEMRPITVPRTGGEHDSDTGFSASRLRRMLLGGHEPWENMPGYSVDLCKKEIAYGRGPVHMQNLELAMLSRLRAIKDFSALSDATEGLDRRFARYAASAPTITQMLDGIKTKRYAMSRIRRMLMCACLGIVSQDVDEPPPYIKVLAMNRVGMKLLNRARKQSSLPIITKPASVHKLSGRAVSLFNKEAAATDFYALSYSEVSNRKGGGEYLQSPIIINA